MIGRVFGRLTVQAEAPKTDKHVKWLCLCSCGNSKIIRGSDLKRGSVRSCGCLVRKHGDSSTRLYDIWSGMRSRCNNKNSKYFPNYGGRGITCSSNWDDFTVFKSWAMSAGYTDKLTIERVDVDKGYSEDNCIWADMFTQNANRRKLPNKSSKYIGVCKVRNNKWSAYAHVKHKRHCLGTFDTEIEAAEARDAFIKKNNLPHKLNF